jgi:RND family efflux transporter MFP subunit
MGMDEAVELVQLVRSSMSRILLSIVLTALSISATSCSPPHGPPSVAAAAQPARANVPSTSAEIPATGDSSNEVVLTGPVTVEQQLDIVALRAGVIVALNADVDTVVHKTQLLAVLDDRQLIADHNAAEFKVKSLESDLKNWEAEVDVRTADLRRAEEMRKEGINTQEAYDHTRYDLTAAKYEVERQRAEMQGAQANLRSLDLELEKTRYAAPFNGIISERHVRLGQYVSLGDKLFHVTGASPLEVRFTLPGAQLTSLKRGDIVTVSPISSFRLSTTATVTHISPVIDPGSDSVEVAAVLNSKVQGLSLGSIASIRFTKAR